MYPTQTIPAPLDGCCKNLRAVWVRILGLLRLYGANAAYPGCHAPHVQRFFHDTIQNSLTQIIDHIPVLHVCC